MEFNFYTFLVVLAIVGVAVPVDLKTRRIPNGLTVPAFVCGVVFHVIRGGWAGLGFSLGGFATGFGILLVLWLIGGGGGGDVKLMGGHWGVVGCTNDAGHFCRQRSLCTDMYVGGHRVVPLLAPGTAGDERRPIGRGGQGDGVEANHSLRGACRDDRGERVPVFYPVSIKIFNVKTQYRNDCVVVLCHFVRIGGNVRGSPISGRPSSNVGIPTCRSKS